MRSSGWHPWDLPNRTAFRLDHAKAMIQRMFQEIEVDKVYTGEVVSITQYCAFMEALPGKDRLVQIFSFKA